MPDPAAPIGTPAPAPAPTGAAPAPAPAPAPAAPAPSLVAPDAGRVVAFPPQPGAPAPAATLADVLAAMPRPFDVPVVAPRAPSPAAAPAAVPPPAAPPAASAAPSGAFQPPPEGAEDDPVISYLQRHDVAARATLESYEARIAAMEKASDARAAQGDRVVISQGAMRVAGSLGLPEANARAVGQAIAAEAIGIYDAGFDVNLATLQTIANRHIAAARAIIEGTAGRTQAERERAAGHASPMGAASGDDEQAAEATLTEALRATGSSARSWAEAGPDDARRAEAHLRRTGKIT